MRPQTEIPSPGRVSTVAFSSGLEENPPIGFRAPRIPQRSVASRSGARARGTAEERGKPMHERHTVPTQDRAIKTRDAILRAAEELFASMGFSGATVDDIAVAGGANKQRIYAYFGSKQKLFEAVLRGVFARVQLLSGEMLDAAEADPAGLTTILLENFLRIHREYPRFWRLLAWANLEPGIDLSVLSDVRSEENRRLRMIFDGAAERGLLAPVSFETYLLTLLSAVYFSHSNRLTLQQTIGCDMLEPENRRNFVAELDRLFRTRNVLP